MKKPPVPSWKRWLKRAAWTAAILVVLAVGFVVWALNTCFAEPPALAGRPAILDQKIAKQGSRHTLGKSWFEQRTGRSMLYVEGDPFTIGYTNAALTNDLLEAQERELIDNVRAILPGTLALYSTALLVLVHNRNLPDFVTDEYRMEIRGLADASTNDPYPEFGNRYHRILNYHAAHDISHWVLDTPALGCTSFAAAGSHTRDGHLLVGRNFDWESGDHFDTNKVIALYRPTKGHAFLSVSWPGMAGAVTGLNDQKIYCSINGAHSADMGLGVGTPVSLVVREVLQYAATLADATKRIRNAKVFVADSFLLADGKTGEAIVVEKTPANCAVRKMQGQWILQSNHFASPQLSGDTGNLEYMRDGTSVARHDRLRELLLRHDGALDPTLGAVILRDRRGPGDAPRGLGNRGTINPMIATHSVLADVTTGTLFVSRGRHQLGAYDAYTIEGFGTPTEAAIPADPALADGTFARLQKYRDAIASIRAELDSGATLSADAEQTLTEARSLNPLAPEVLIWTAEAHERRRENPEALAMFRAARKAVPPFGPDRERVDEAIERLTNQP